MDPIAQQKETADKLIQQAERSKARMMEVPGTVVNKLANNVDSERFLNKLTGEFMHSMLVDEEYSMVASHVDEHLRRKIVQGSYIDFARLLPQDNAVFDEDDYQKYVMCQKGGNTFWLPESEAKRDPHGINSLFRWDQAFRGLLKYLY